MKKLVWIISLLTCATFSSAQVNWLQSYGGFSNEEIVDLAVDSNGDLIHVGYFFGALDPGSGNMNSAGNSDIFIMKTDDDGNLIWAIQAGGTGPDKAESVATDAAGNIYVTGYFHTSANFGVLNATGLDREAFVCKIDNSGTFQWVSSMGGQFGDAGFGIDVAASGNVYVTGEYRGNATFGADNLTSMANTADVFISKLDNSGNFIWTRDGQAPQDDRGTSITVDNSENVYVVGEFSEDITFDILHPNLALNAGFVVSYNSTGTEQWFDLFRAGQVLLNDIEYQANNLYVTGDFRGNLIVDDINSTETFLSAYEYNILTTKLGTNGNLTWLSSEFSDSEVFSNQITLDASNNIYITGVFKCIFTGMNENYGNSTFHSVGYRDVHYMKYNNSGAWQYARQVGGTKDENCSAIVAKLVDEPIISGSYENLINVPSGANFAFQLGQFIQVLNNNCGDVTNGNYAREFAIGAKDIFMTNSYDANRLPYDYYIKYTACDYDTIPPCILNCQDTADMCINNSFLNVNHFQEPDGIRPDYDYTWNTGSTQPYIFPGFTGDYWVYIEREDGCMGWHDTIHAVVHPLPLPPLITDSWAVNYYAEFPELVDSCGLDSLYLWATPADGITDTIWWDNGTYINDSTIHAPSTDTYYAYAMTEYGCTAFNEIEVSLDTFALHDTMDLHIIFDDLILNATDSILVCENYPNIVAHVFDSSFVSLFGATPDKWTFWFLDGIQIDSIFHYPDTFGTISFDVPDTGWFNLEARLINECGDTVEYIFDRDFHVGFIPDPALNLIGPTLACPGDTVMIVADYNTNSITWTATTMIQNFTDSISVQVNTGTTIIQAVVDTTVGNTVCSAQQQLTILTDPQPPISISPSDGYICPGDSVMLTALNGVAWEWIGPFGDILGNGSFIYATDPGDYYANVTLPSGCTLSSNFLTATAYSSPYLELLNPIICEGETTDLEVFGPSGMTINWLAPLSGSANIQTVSNEGWYYVETDFCGIFKTDSALVTFSDVDATLNVVGDTTICSNDTLLLVAQSGYANYLWNGTNGSNTFEATQAGTYILEAEDALGCTDLSDTVTIIHYPAPPAPIVSDTTICLGADVTLSASGQGGLLWYDGGNIIQTGNTLDLTNVQSAVSYTVINDDTTCSGNASVLNVSIYSGSITPIIYGDSSVCEGDYLVLNSNVADSLISYNWVGPAQTSSDSLFIMHPVLAADAGTYYLSFTDSFCTSEIATFELEVIPTILDLEIAYNEPCEGDSILITLSPQTFQAYYWLQNGGIFNTLPTATVPTEGISSYDFDVVVNNQGCFSDTAHFSIPVNQNPISNLPNDTLFCIGELVQNGTSYNYDWVMSDNPDIFYDSLLVITYTDEFGCITVDSTNITFQECNLFKPNIFTPNGDGANDYFFFDADKGIVISFIVLNRWGVTIYESFNNNWNGQDKNGDDVPEGWYYYVLNYQNYNQELLDVHGTFFLTRTSD